jgi:inward rectifier potassium channel
MMRGMSTPASPSAPWRLVRRDGRVSVVRRNLPRAPLQDLYHHLLTASWPRLLILYAGLFTALNVLFALLYRAGGDTVANAHSPLDYFFFSVQTMCTIGYGVLAPQGLYANLLTTMEAFTGVAIFALATGIAFAKFSRPTARVLFSNVAVIRPWEGGVPALLFRIANARGNRIVDAHITATLVRRRRAPRGGSMRRFHNLPLARSHAAFFALSWTAVHLIDTHSPLSGMHAEHFRRSEAEIIISLVGHDESFAQTVHARHSYVAAEIIWDAHFVDILSSDENGQPVLDYAHFHDVEPLETGPEGEGPDPTLVG